MRRNLHYLNSLLVPAMAYIAVGLGGWWGLLPWGVTFGLIALIELLLPENTDNQHDSDGALASRYSRPALDSPRRTARVVGPSSGAGGLLS
ncbi:MAG: hypothetical protein KatS3mg026_0053 [Bacteroidia bacterium]|nr:MAG: hypothetical protein KatS3mg026_0053 [Bacteroidia bacterium]